MALTLMPALPRLHLLNGRFTHNDLKAWCLMRPYPLLTLSYCHGVSMYLSRRLSKLWVPVNY